MVRDDAEEDDDSDDHLMKRRCQGTGQDFSPIPTQKLSPLQVATMIITTLVNDDNYDADDNYDENYDDNDNYDDDDNYTDENYDDAENYDDDNYDDNDNYNDDSYNDQNYDYDNFAPVLPDSPPNISGLSSSHSPGSFLRWDWC